MLAHEIGHLVRRDPGWLLFCALLERILFFQPLNRLGRRQLQDTAEYICDDYAIRLMGGGNLPLAKCLAKVASWIEEPTPNAFAAGMVGDPSTLLRRVQRLLDDRSREIARVSKKLPAL